LPKIEHPEAPRLLLLQATDLIAVRSAVAAGDSLFLAADELLLEEADAATVEGPFSVLDKEAVPPSGDPHDYMSMGPFWWPDPEQPDGKPYIRRDGEGNPEAAGLDRPAMGRMCAAVNTLSAAYFFTDHEAFAEHAALLLRTWFIDPTTRMNPHLRYGQAVPGRCEGRGIGIIDTLQLSRLVDAIGLLSASPVWNSEDQCAMETWFAAYLDWLLTSEHGEDERGQRNNHGTWYDVQVASMGLFTGRDEVAQAVLGQVGPRRIASQIEPDGRQPLELRRTRSLSYSAANLLGFLDLAVLGDRVGIDLWGWESSDGRSLRRAFNWLVQYAPGCAQWEGQQISPFEDRQWIPLLRRGGLGFGDPACEKLLQALPAEMSTTDRTQLLYPLPGSVEQYRIETGGESPC
jgi:hypothetical protein